MGHYWCFIEVIGVLILKLLVRMLLCMNKRKNWQKVYQKLLEIVFLFQARTPLKKKKITCWAVVVHSFNLSTWEAEAGGTLSSRLGWSTEQQDSQGYKEKSCPKSQREKERESKFLVGTSEREVIRNIKWGWRDGSALGCTRCTCIGPRFCSHMVVCAHS